MGEVTGAKDISARHLEVKGDRVRYRCYVYPEGDGFTAFNPDLQIGSFAETRLAAAQGVAEMIIEDLNMCRMFGMLEDHIARIPQSKLKRRISWRASYLAERFKSFFLRREAELIEMKMEEPFLWTDEQCA